MVGHHALSHANRCRTGRSRTETRYAILLEFEVAGDFLVHKILPPLRHRHDLPEA